LDAIIAAWRVGTGNGNAGSRWSSLLDRRQFVTGTLVTVVGTWIVSLTGRLSSFLAERASYIGQQPLPEPLPPGRGWISQPQQYPQSRVNGSFIFGVPTPLRARTQV